MLVFAALLMTAGAAAPAPSPPAEPAAIPFRTDTAPRMDPVFGDAVTLRAAIDRFAVLQVQMDRVRDEFSTAVHDTLASLPATAGGPRPTAAICPGASVTPYGRALEAGGRYLMLGRQLQARYRDIRRGDDAGDTLGLTPDYRWKARKVRAEFAHLLADYREMRVAFYDQLGAELRHAGCKTGRAVAARAGASAGVADAPVTAAPNPTDPAAWALDPGDDDTPPLAGRALPMAATSPAPEPPAPSPSAATAIWIDIDNSLCPEPTRVLIDGQPMGELPARDKTSIRTHAGPHELCVLPSTDKRQCGDPGTRRKAYLHEGWSLTVHCNR